MARPKTFYFEPYQSHRGRHQREHAPWASVNKNGNMVITKESMEMLGEEFNVKLIKLFIDKGKGAIGWQFVEKVDGLAEIKKLRTITPHTNETGWSSYQFNVLGMVNEIGGVGLPIKKTEIKGYVDEDPYMHLGKIYYIELK